MIISMKPLSLSEAKDMIEKLDEKKELEDYFKTFCKLDSSKAEKLRAEIEALNNVKFKEEYIVKVIDILPKDSEEVNKIFHDVSLEEGDINAILDIVKNY